MCAAFSSSSSLMRFVGSSLSDAVRRFLRYFSTACSSISSHSTSHQLLSLRFIVMRLAFYPKAEGLVS